MNQIESDKVKIIIGGDVCPAGDSLRLFEEGDATGLFGSFLLEFSKADCVVLNLECPLFDGDSPIVKDGPVLKASTRSINALKAASIDAVNLANNHALDHCEVGLRSTIEVCNHSGIQTIGAGVNLEAARRIHVINKKGVKIGFLALAEHEFSIAGTDCWGVNPLDLIDYVRNIKQNINKWDHLIVLLHGGAENYPLPSPRLMDTCRFLIEMGANAVVCQHSHCAGCYEEYLGGFIVYGQGNLLFDYPNQAASWYVGFLVNLEIEKNGKTRFSILPFQQSRGAIGISRLPEEEEKEFLNTIRLRSKSIIEQGFVKSQWEKFCKEHHYYYINKTLGHNRIVRWLNRTGTITRLLYSQRSLLGIHNILSCESNREVMELIFEMMESKKL